MTKPRYSALVKMKAVQEYLNGEGTYRQIASRYGTNDRTLRTWMEQYEKYGESAFIKRTKNSSYSSEFKVKCVKMVLSGQKTIKEMFFEYNLSSESTLKNWIRKYNAKMELKDYFPQHEVYMAKASRKTTLEERKEIVNHCIHNNYNYKDTAAFFAVSYSQVYSWVKKYKKDRDYGLIDNRGHHKSDEEVDELERLRRENKILKQKLKENDMLVQLLKKAKEFERK